MTNCCYERLRSPTNGETRGLLESDTLVTTSRFQPLASIRHSTPSRLYKKSIGGLRQAGYTRQNSRRSQQCQSSNWKSDVTVLPFIKRNLALTGP